MTSKEGGYDGDDDIPLHRKRPFGSGLQRKPIAFVPASDGSLHMPDPMPEARPAPSVAETYLSMVLPKEHGRAPASQEAPKFCSVCHMPLTEAPGNGQDRRSGGERPPVTLYPRNSHESSLAHQVCLAHSHPPSALDRSRMGLSYLESHGWDPDSRAGLGAAQQGIKFPIKEKAKYDNLGVGLALPKDGPNPRKKQKPQQLDARKVRKMVQEDKKRAERLQRHLYSNHDIERYLGAGLGG